ncbi:MAG TPA: glutaminyl-peptide cyclotransferase [Thermoanaerobaculia bacterium]|jgi:glutamine cyclotransferase|nr:glutaminyl-peptide cyclotransferase [Thermoanaerobaculia bacterium]
MTELSGGVLLALFALAVGCGGDGRAAAPAEGVPVPGASAAPPPAAERLTVRVVARHPHDATAFTQGLLWHGGKLYESTGLYGRSSLRRVDLASGRVEERVDLPASLFGEGLALAGDRLVQLTWKEGRALFWSPATLAPLGERSYSGDGWGLASDGRRLVQSDGSSHLTYRDPQSFVPTGTLAVTDHGQPVALLNELEVVDGAIYANLWTTDEIVRIDPANGRVTARIDAGPLHEEVAQQGVSEDAVLNGIAWRPETATFLLTGKLWPTLFEVQLVPYGS